MPGNKQSAVEKFKAEHPGAIPQGLELLLQELSEIVLRKQPTTACDTYSIITEYLGYKLNEQPLESGDQTQEKLKAKSKSNKMPNSDDKKPGKNSSNPNLSSTEDRPKTVTKNEPENLRPFSEKSKKNILKASKASNQVTISSTPQIDEHKLQSAEGQSESRKGLKMSEPQMLEGNESQTIVEQSKSTKVPKMSESKTKTGRKKSLLGVHHSQQSIDNASPCTDTERKSSEIETIYKRSKNIGGDQSGQERHGQTGRGIGGLTQGPTNNMDHLLDRLSALTEILDSTVISTKTFLDAGDLTHNESAIDAIFPEVPFSYEQAFDTNPIKESLKDIDSEAGTFEKLSDLGHKPHELDLMPTPHKSAIESGAPEQNFSKIKTKPSASRKSFAPTQDLNPFRMNSNLPSRYFDVPTQQQSVVGARQLGFALEPQPSIAGVLKYPHPQMSQSQTNPFLMNSNLPSRYFDLPTQQQSVVGARQLGFALEPQPSIVGVLKYPHPQMGQSQTNPFLPLPTETEEEGNAAALAEIVKADAIVSKTILLVQNNEIPENVGEKIQQNIKLLLEEINFTRDSLIRAMDISNNLAVLEKFQVQNAPHGPCTVSQIDDQVNIILAPIEETGLPSASQSQASVHEGIYFPPPSFPRMHGRNSAAAVRSAATHVLAQRVEALNEIMNSVLTIGKKCGGVPSEASMSYFIAGSSPAPTSSVLNPHPENLDAEINSSHPHPPPPIQAMSHGPSPAHTSCVPYPPENLEIDINWSHPHPPPIQTPSPSHRSSKNTVPFGPHEHINAESVGTSPSTITTIIEPESQDGTTPSGRLIQKQTVHRKN